MILRNYNFVKNVYFHIKNNRKIFNSRSLRNISRGELNRLQSNYEFECEDGTEGITRADFIKNMPGRDVSKQNKCKMLTRKDEKYKLSVTID